MLNNGEYILVQRNISETKTFKTANYLSIKNGITFLNITACANHVIVFKKRDAI